MSGTFKLTSFSSFSVPLVHPPRSQVSLSRLGALLSLPIFPVALRVVFLDRGARLRIPILLYCFRVRHRLRRRGIRSEAPLR